MYMKIRSTDTVSKDSSTLSLQGISSRKTKCDDVEGWIVDEIKGIDKNVSFQQALY